MWKNISYNTVPHPSAGRKDENMGRWTWRGEIYFSKGEKDVREVMEGGMGIAV